MLNELPFLLIVSMVFFRSAMLAQTGRAPFGLVSGISAAVYLSCLWVPAHLQSSGLIVSKIARAGILAPPTGEEIASLSLRWALEMLVILCAEIAMGAVARMHKQRSSARTGEGTITLLHRKQERRRVVNFLIGFGIIAVIVFPAKSLESRTAGGAGVSVIMASFLVIGLSMLAYYNFFQSRLYQIVAALGIAFLIYGSVRSPLLVVLFGYVAGLVSRGQLRSKTMLRLGALAVFIALFGALMSNVRGNILRGGQVGIADLLSETVQSPYVSVYQAGIDTLDGYRLSQLIQPNEDARPLSILTVVTNFVPRAVWPDKPTDLSVEMSAKYLNYKSGGQFLSPVGYLSIAFGGYVGALCGLFVVICTFVPLALKFSKSFVLAIVICTVVRFMMGGAPFDLYYGLTLTLPLIASTLIVRAYSSLRRPKRVGSAGNENALHRSPRIVAH